MPAARGGAHRASPAAPDVAATGGDPAVRGLDVAMSGMSAIGVPAQDAANDKHQYSNSQGC
jgi:hypothetical protein